MKALLCKAYGGPDDLVLEETDPPAVGPGDVHIAIHAAGVNFPDILLIENKYQVHPPLPFAPGLEVAGRVLAVGADVTRFKPGDRVMACCGHGGFAEEVAVAERSVFALPDAVDFVTAAGFPVVYGTTYHGLIDRGRMQAGEVLLVHGAAGGVGLSAVDMGKMLGATVIGTVGADAKMDIVRQYGADHVINYSTESIRDRVKELTDGKGADVIYDPVGGDAFDQSMRCINWAGRLLVIGFASGRIPELKANLALLKGCEVVGVFWGSFSEREPERSRGNFDTLLGWCAEGKLKPHVSMRFPLAQGGEALKALISRRATGKVIVDVRDEQ
jgi:NADPH2:quinone reductase